MNVDGLDGPLVAAPVGSDEEPWCSLDHVDSAARLHTTRWVGDEGTAQIGLTIVVVGDRIWSLSDVWGGETLALPLSRMSLHDLLKRLVYSDCWAG
jgi:hypothetical protein